MDVPVVDDIVENKSCAPDIVYVESEKVAYKEEQKVLSMLGDNITNLVDGKHTNAEEGQGEFGLVECIAMSNINMNAIEMVRGDEGNLVELAEDVWKSGCLEKETKNQNEEYITKTYEMDEVLGFEVKYLKYNEVSSSEGKTDVVDGENRAQDVVHVQFEKIRFVQEEKNDILEPEANTKLEDLEIKKDQESSLIGQKEMQFQMSDECYLTMVRNESKLGEVEPIAMDNVNSNTIELAQNEEGGQLKFTENDILGLEAITNKLENMEPKKDVESNIIGQEEVKFQVNNGCFVTMVGNERKLGVVEPIAMHDVNSKTIELPQNKESFQLKFTENDSLRLKANTNELEDMELKKDEDSNIISKEEVEFEVNNECFVTMVRNESKLEVVEPIAMDNVDSKSTELAQNEESVQLKYTGNGILGLEANTSKLEDMKLKKSEESNIIGQEEVEFQVNNRSVVTMVINESKLEVAEAIEMDNFSSKTIELAQNEETKQMKFIKNDILGLDTNTNNFEDMELKKNDESNIIGQEEAEFQVNDGRFVIMVKNESKLGVVKPIAIDNAKLETTKSAQNEESGRLKFTENNWKSDCLIKVEPKIKKEAAITNNTGVSVVNLEGIGDNKNILTPLGIKDKITSLQVQKLDDNTNFEREEGSTELVQKFYYTMEEPEQNVIQVLEDKNNMLQDEKDKKTFENITSIKEEDELLVKDENVVKMEEKGNEIEVLESVAVSVVDLESTVTFRCEESDDLNLGRNYLESDCMSTTDDNMQIDDPMPKEVQVVTIGILDINDSKCFLGREEQNIKFGDATNFVTSEYTEHGAIYIEHKKLNTLEEHEVSNRTKPSPSKMGQEKETNIEDDNTLNLGEMEPLLKNLSLDATDTRRNNVLEDEREMEVTYVTESCKSEVHVLVKEKSNTNEFKLVELDVKINTDVDTIHIKKCEDVNEVEFSKDDWKSEHLEMVETMFEEEAPLRANVGVSVFTLKGILDNKSHMADWGMKQETSTSLQVDTLEDNTIFMPKKYIKPEKVCTKFEKLHYEAEEQEKNNVLVLHEKCKVLQDEKEQMAFEHTKSFKEEVNLLMNDDNVLKMVAEGNELEVLESVSMSDLDLKSIETLQCEMHGQMKLGRDYLESNCMTRIGDNIEIEESKLNEVEFKVVGIQDLKFEMGGSGLEEQYIKLPSDEKNEDKTKFVEDEYSEQFQVHAKFNDFNTLDENEISYETKPNVDKIGDKKETNVEEDNKLVHCELKPLVKISCLETSDTGRNNILENTKEMEVACVIESYERDVKFLEKEDSKRNKLELVELDVESNADLDAIQILKNEHCDEVEFVKDYLGKDSLKTVQAKIEEQPSQIVNIGVIVMQKGIEDNKKVMDDCGMEEETTTFSQVKMLDDNTKLVPKRYIEPTNVSTELKKLNYVEKEHVQNDSLVLHDKNNTLDNDERYKKTFEDSKSIDREVEFFVEDDNAFKEEAMGNELDVLNSVAINYFDSDSTTCFHCGDSDQVNFGRDYSKSDCMATLQSKMLIEDPTPKDVQDCIVGIQDFELEVGVLGMDKKNINHPLVEKFEDNINFVANKYGEQGVVHFEYENLNSLEKYGDFYRSRPSDEKFKDGKGFSIKKGNRLFFGDMEPTVKNLNSETMDIGINNVFEDEEEMKVAYISESCVREMQCFAKEEADKNKFEFEGSDVTSKNNLDAIQILQSEDIDEVEFCKDDWRSECCGVCVVKLKDIEDSKTFMADWRMEQETATSLQVEMLCNNTDLVNEKLNPEEKEWGPNDIVVTNEIDNIVQDEKDQTTFEYTKSVEGVDEIQVKDENEVKMLAKRNEPKIMESTLVGDPYLKSSGIFQYKESEQINLGRYYLKSDCMTMKDDNMKIEESKPKEVEVKVADVLGMEEQNIELPIAEKNEYKTKFVVDEYNEQVEVQVEYKNLNILEDQEVSSKIDPNASKCGDETTTNMEKDDKLVCCEVEPSLKFLNLVRMDIGKNNMSENKKEMQIAKNIELCERGVEMLVKIEEKSNKFELVEPDVETNVDLEAIQTIKSKHCDEVEFGNNYSEKGNLTLAEAKVDEEAFLAVKVGVSVMQKGMEDNKNIIDDCGMENKTSSSSHLVPKKCIKPKNISTEFDKFDFGVEDNEENYILVLQDKISTLEDERDKKTFVDIKSAEEEDEFLMKHKNVMEMKAKGNELEVRDLVAASDVDSKSTKCFYENDEANFGGDYSKSDCTTVVESKMLIEESSLKDVDDCIVGIKDIQDNEFVVDILGPDEKIINLPTMENIEDKTNFVDDEYGVQGAVHPEYENLNTFEKGEVFHGAEPIDGNLGNEKDSSIEEVDILVLGEMEAVVKNLCLETMDTGTSNVSKDENEMKFASINGSCEREIKIFVKEEANKNIFELVESDVKNNNSNVETIQNLKCEDVDEVEFCKDNWRSECSAMVEANVEEMASLTARSTVSFVRQKDMEEDITFMADGEIQQETTTSFQIETLWNNTNLDVMDSENANTKVENLNHEAQEHEQNNILVSTDTGNILRDDKDQSTFKQTEIVEGDVKLLVKDDNEVEMEAGGNGTVVMESTSTSDLYLISTGISQCKQSDQDNLGRNFLKSDSVTIIDNTMQIEESKPEGFKVEVVGLQDIQVCKFEVDVLGSKEHNIKLPLKQKNMDKTKYISNKYNDQVEVNVEYKNLNTLNKHEISYRVEPNAVKLGNEKETNKLVHCEMEPSVKILSFEIMDTERNNVLENEEEIEVTQVIELCEGEVNLLMKEEPAMNKFELVASNVQSNDDQEAIQILNCEDCFEVEFGKDYSEKDYLTMVKAKAEDEASLTANVRVSVGILKGIEDNKNVMNACGIEETTTGLQVETLENNTTLVPEKYIVSENISIELEKLNYGEEERKAMTNTFEQEKDIGSGLLTIKEQINTEGADNMVETSYKVNIKDHVAMDDSVIVDESQHGLEESVVKQNVSLPNQFGTSETIESKFSSMLDCEHEEHDQIKEMLENVSVPDHSVQFSNIEGDLATDDKEMEAHNCAKTKEEETIETSDNSAIQVVDSSNISIYVIKEVTNGDEKGADFSILASDLNLVTSACLSGYNDRKVAFNLVDVNAIEKEKKLHQKLELVRLKFLHILSRMRKNSSGFDLGNHQKRVSEHQEKSQKDVSFLCNILVLGKIGVGKSTTINSIIGEEKIKINAFDGPTTNVRLVSGVVDGIKVNIIDTPGLRTNVMDQGWNRKILSSIKSYTKKCPPDIILYVDRLDFWSNHLDDISLLRTITTTLGTSIWVNTIVTLTHAASIPPDNSNGDPMAYETFIAQRSHIVQQSIQQTVGDMCLMNAICFVENHPYCWKNCQDKNELPTWQDLRNHLLILCYPTKTKYQQKISVNHRRIKEDSYIEVDNCSEICDDEYGDPPTFCSLMKEQFNKLMMVKKNDEYGYHVKLVQEMQFDSGIQQVEENKTSDNSYHNACEYGSMACQNNQDPRPKH